MAGLDLEARYGRNNSQTNRYAINQLPYGLTESELQVVRKYYELYSDLIPEDRTEIPAFLDSISKYEQCKERHNDDEMLTNDVSQIVDQYFSENGKVLCPFGECGGTFEIDDNKIEARKQRMIDWIKNARDKQGGPIYYHYVGADSSSDELCKFYYFVYGKYYEIIGTTWENR